MTEEGRRILSEAILATAGALPYWRDGIVLLLGALVIGLLLFAATMYEWV